MNTHHQTDTKGKSKMTNTIFIHGGASDKGIKVIRELLQENDYTNNTIKNVVLCADTPENIYKVQEFLGFDEFTYLPMTPEAPLDINQNITKVIIIPNEKAE